MKLLDPWEKLGPDDARRVHPHGRYDFFWVVLEDGVPGLMLKLTSPLQGSPRLPRLRNLAAWIRPVASGSAFVLSLKEPGQIEIFETLCRDIVETGEAAQSTEEALLRTIQRTQRWHHMLRGGSVKGLSVEEQRGLIGELAFLRDVASDLGPETAIEAWTGPNGAIKDFEFIGTCVEIKTRRSAARPYVSISSADQLADVDDCNLFLRVLNVSSAVSPEGLTLHDHVNMTGRLFEEAGIAFDKWEDALFATGYDSTNDYENRRWNIGGQVTYKVEEDFPRIMAPLAPGVERVSYSLSLEACANFETDIDLIKLIREGINNE